MGKEVFLKDASIDELRDRLITHPLYETLANLDHLRLFMENHVFAVWDFMSIVKSLQRDLTCISVPWRPVEDVQSARLINEIVLQEESDDLPDGSFGSHFQLYLEAMEEAGADTEKIRRFIRALSEGESVRSSLDMAETPLPAKGFVETTFGLLSGTPLHIRAAALFYGREDLIPNMFEAMVREMHESGEPCGKFVYYLNRHIQLDGEEHSHFAEDLLMRACAGDPYRREESRQTAIRVLRARLTFWDGILSSVPPRIPAG